MSSFVIDTSRVQLGQVIRNNITDQGIFRTFYNDISGNMYCALSRESNYKQVVYNSAYKRTVMDNSGMNAPFYGGTYHPNELTYVDNSRNFYIFKYPTEPTNNLVNQCITDRGPISYFTEVQLQSYILQGDSSGNTPLYDTNGGPNSSTISDNAYIRYNGGADAAIFNWFEQVGFGHCTTESGGYGLDPSSAAAVAKDMGLPLGGGGLSFTNPPPDGIYGLYAYNNDATYGNSAFFGMGGAATQIKRATGSSTKLRPGVPATTTMALYVPDLMYLDRFAPTSDQNGVTNKPLNDLVTGSYSYDPNSSTIRYRFNTEPWEEDISNNSSFGPSSLNVKYYIAAKRPKYIWMDASNKPISPWPNNWQIEDTDSYYKGRWSIYVDVKNKVRSTTPPYSLIDNDTSGNIYISRSNRAHKPVYTHQLITHYTNSQSGTTQEIKNVFVDLDLDISKNAYNKNYTNIYARPYYVVTSDASSNLTYGYAPYDLYYSMGTGNTHLIVKNTIDGIDAGYTNRHCKIKVDYTSSDYSQTRWHIVYFHTGVANQNAYLAYATGISGEEFDPTNNGDQEHFTIQLPARIRNSPGGGFPSMDIDKDGKVHIAYLTKRYQDPGPPQHPWCIMYLKAKNVKPENHTTSWWEYTTIEDLGDATGGGFDAPGGTYYTDLSNNQPINLKISPYDQSTHITYQYKNPDGTYSIKYWTNSENTKDISGIDSSLNYVGLHTKGSTINDISGSAEVYWDLSQVNCIFSRDYTRYDDNGNKIGLTTSENTVKQFIAPYGARPGLGVGQTDKSCTTNQDNPTQGWMSGINFNRTFLDKVYIITTIKTPSDLTSGGFYSLFSLAGGPVGVAQYGGYTASIAPGNAPTGGYVSFGISANSGSSIKISTRRDYTGGIPYKNGAPFISTQYGVDTLLPDKNYQLEFYYNKGNSYGFIKIKNLDNPLINNTYEYYDISVNGGFNIKDGPLSIGNTGHEATGYELRGTMYKMSIYATDISNVPTFDLERNGEIVSDANGSFSSFWDNSGNVGLDIEPKITEFQVVNAVNSLNNGGLSGSSYIKKCLLHDVYYYQRIDDQSVPVINQYSKQFINAFDKFTIKNSQGYYEMWAAGHSANGTGNESITPMLLKSLDGGLTWSGVPGWNDNANLAVISEEILSIKCFVDSNIQPDGYGGKWVFLVGEEFMIHVSNDYNSSGIVDRSQLGINWKIIGSAPDPSGNGNPHGFYFQNTTQALYSVCPTRINEAESTAIFGGAPAGGYNHHFHLWIGATYMWYYGGAPPSDLLIRGNYTDYSNNTCDYSNNLISYQIRDSSDNPTSTDTRERGPRTYSFGGDYSGNSYNTAGYSYGIVGTDNYIYQTNDGGNIWNKRLGVDGVWLADCGGGYPGAFERGVQGSYIEKNPNPSGVYDNSGIYAQMSTEAWNGLPGFTVAYNDSSFNLAFNPQDNTNAPKDTTWDPELNANSFWNVQIPDNSGQPVLWKYGGSNSIKTYIDNKSSAGGVFKNKQQMWAVDDFIAGDSTTSAWGTDHTETPNLYLRDSELDNQWQRVVPSVVDPSLNTYPENQSLSWAGFSDYDCSYSIVNLAFANDANKQIFNTVGDTNQYVGFYKLGKVPPKVFLEAKIGDPAIEPYTIRLNIKYKINDTVQYFLNDNQRLNFTILGITAHFEERQKTGSGPYGNWSEVITVQYDYFATLSDKIPGKTFQYRVRLSNKHGYGWYSNESDEITTPSPSPTIDKLTIQTKLFETIVTWKPQEVGNVQSVYSYNIQKQYFDVSLNQYIEEPNFTDFYQDLSGQLNDLSRWGSINGELWTGPYNPTTGAIDLGVPTDLSFVDIDLSLNTTYRYNITAYPLIAGTVPSQTYTIYTITSTALPLYQQYKYSANDASFNILWTMDTDISSNCELTWDISWQEIRNDNTVDNSGIIQILDISAAVNGQGVGKKRCVNLPLLNTHLQADASYNFQMKSDLSNNSWPPADYDPATAKYQQYLYGGYAEYDPSNVNVYYNYQEPPTLNNASYVDNTVNINWSATTIPTNPVAYDVSFSNITSNREDVSYNFIVDNGTSLVDPSGENYYPGDYNVRVKAYYGNQVPVDISLVSQWSNELPLSGGVPEHLPSILTATPYNNNDQPGNNTDVSYVKLTWNSVGNDDFALNGFPIPENYTLVRKTASKDYNYIVDYATDIPRTETSFNDVNFPLGHTNPQGGPTIPRIYYYDLSANYK